MWVFFTQMPPGPRRQCLNPASTISKWLPTRHASGYSYTKWFDTLWRHQMKTFSALLALCEGNPPVTGGFPSQRPVTRSFDVFCDLCLNKRLSKEWRRWWFETSSRSWRHCNKLSVCCARTTAWSSSSSMWESGWGHLVIWLLQPQLIEPIHTGNMVLFHSLQWRHNKRDAVSNNRRLDCLPKRLFRRKLKERSKLRATGLCEGTSPATGEFPA